MGTTTNYAIPYPEPTDFVTDGATAMESIAEQVDAQMFATVANRNLLYNAAIQVAQRGTSTASITTTNYYTADRWQHGVETMGTWTSTIENDAPTGSGFRKSLKMLCTTADASPAAGDNVAIQQLLEGQDLQAIRKGTSSAQSISVSFWVKSNRTGTYIAELYDFDNTRQCSKSYVINATATWEYKTVTFPADTIGALDNDASQSLMLKLWLGAGSTFSSGTLNQTWASVTAANRAVGQVNVASAINNYWQITGVQMTIGAVAPPFQFKAFQQDLAECQRYYIQDSLKARFTFWMGGDAYMDSNMYTFPVSMRSSPVMVIRDNAGTAGQVYAVYGGGSFGNITATATGYTDGFIIQRGSMVTNSGGKAACSYTASAELT